MTWKRIICLLILCWGASSCVEMQASRARAWAAIAAQKGDPGLVVGQCYWVDGDLMPKVGGGNKLLYTPIPGAEVEVFALNVDDGGGSLLVDSGFSDEQGTTELYLPPGDYRMCAAWGEKRSCSMDFVVRSDEQVEVVVRINRRVVH